MLSSVKLSENVLLVCNIHAYNVVV